MSDTTTKTAVLVSIAGVIGTLLGATVAPLVTYLTNERQMDVKMVEIGIGILREPPKEGTAVMREWAIDLIQSSSRRAFSDEQRHVLLNNELLISPTEPFTSAERRRLEETIRKMQRGKF